MVITLLPKNVASIGYQFTQLGRAQICNKCPLLKVCVDVLHEHFTYRVTEIKKKEHKCLVDNQTMIVCNVEVSNDIISVRKQKFLEHIILNRESIVCDEILCKYYENCVSPIYNKLEKIKIIKIIEDIKCPLEFDLVLVEAKKING